MLQSAWFLLDQVRTYPAGAWDEDLLWLYGPQGLDAPVRPRKVSDFRARVAGYYCWRSSHSHLFLRCGRFRFRPSQADMLHVDLWWNGTNIAIDPGTYSYNSPKPWNNPFASTAYHNTVSIEGTDQMRKFSRFLWLPWVEGKVRRERDLARSVSYFEGQIKLGRALTAATHARGVLRLPNNRWLVLDSFRAPRPEEVRLHWLFQDLPFEWDPDLLKLGLRVGREELLVQLGCSSEGVQRSLVRACPTSPRGWQATHYLCRKPALSLVLNQPSRDLLFWTLFGSPGNERCSLTPGKLTIDLPNLAVEIGLCSGEGVVRSLVVRDQTEGME